MLFLSKTQYLKDFFLVCILVLFFCGCKKDKESDEQYLRMSIDGTKVECTQNLKAVLVEISTPGSLFIDGAWSEGSLEINYFGYKGSGEAYVSNAIGLRFTLWALGTSFYAGDGGISGTQNGTGTINIQDLSGSYIKGTFSFVTAATNGVSKTVTNGDFRLKKT